MINQRENRAAHALMPPFRLTNRSSASESGLYTAAYRIIRDFALRAISIARGGVALLVRSAWSEGGDRYRDLFSKHPPALIAQFAERVPMVKGRRNPASSATA
jgi:hypothetical protein